jgi:hypothetical protein
MIQMPEKNRALYFFSAGWGYVGVRLAGQKTQPERCSASPEADDD